MSIQSENEDIISTICTLENNDFKVETNKKERTIKIFKRDYENKEWCENPLFVSHIDESDDIKEAHQKMLEYMYLNNRAPQDDFAGDEIGRYEVKRSED